MERFESRRRLHLMEEAAEAVKIMEDLDETDLAEEDKLYPLLAEEITKWRAELDT